MNHSTKKYLIIILALGFLLRVWMVNKYPPGLTWDEASLGYNAYSIGTTLKDEYGAFLPMTLKSFGDYKPAFYTYLDIPFVLIFGLNEYSVRLPSVLAGTLAILVVYLLILELFKEKRLAILASLMMAISPYSIQFSRAAFEANVALTLNLLGVLFFIYGLKNPKKLFISVLFFCLSLITYQSARLFVPMLLLGLIILSWKQLKFNKQFLIPGILFLVFLVTLGSMIILKKQTGRLEVQSLFSYTRSPEQITQISEEDGMNIQSPQFQILHGEYFAFTRTLFERYLIYFSPKMLFLDGDYSPRHSVPDLGVTYYFSLILIPLGFYYLLNSSSFAARIFFFWLIIAPIPAVLSRDLIQTLRALNFAFPLAVLEGAGLFVLTKYFILKGWIGRLVLVGFLIFGIFNFIIYLDRYYIHMTYEASKDWSGGYKETILEVKNQINNKKYDSIVFSDSYGQPYIYYLFYNKYPAQLFQKQSALEQTSSDVGTIRKLDNIQFRHVYWPTDRGTKNSLFIGTLEELPDQDILPFPEYKILKEIKFPDGSIAFRIVETK